jgi:hypothetical protein
MPSVLVIYFLNLKLKVMNVSLERLEQIEKERNKTMGDRNFQQWMKELNVSQSYQDRSAIINAMDLLKQYDYSTYKFLNN